MTLGFTRRRLRFMWRYWRGDVPWDSGIVPPEVIAWLDAAQAAGTPPGRALDLGCGTGTTTIELARRGWTAVGVDFAANAIGRARRKARRAQVTQRASFVVADVGAPDPGGSDFLRDAAPFELVIDVGCLHGLDAAARTVYAARLLRLTRPGATFLLYAFLPRRDRHGQLMGIDSEELIARLGPAFEVVERVAGEEVTTPLASAWFTLRRTEAAL